MEKLPYKLWPEELEPMRSKERGLESFDQPQREAFKPRTNLVEALKMKIIICFRHLKCIGRKWWRGMDYSWHMQHLLREFGLGQFARRKIGICDELPLRRTEGTLVSLE